MVNKRASFPAAAAAGSLAVAGAFALELSRHPVHTLTQVARGYMLLGGAQEKICKVHGVPIHYYQAGEQGDPLVLVHGLGGSAENWVLLLPVLSRVYRVYALDLPGSGRSPFAPEGAGVRTLTHYLQGFIETLELGRVVVAGHSLGGWVATRYAFEQPEQVQRLYLINSAGLHREGLNSPFTPDRKSAYRYLRGMGYRGPLPGFVLDSLVRRSRHPTYTSFMKSYDPKDELDECLPHIKAPTTVFWGERDRILPLQCAKDLVRGIPNSRLISIPHAGHLPTITAARDIASVMIDDAIL
jgi:pimeloyl-ACP methyl ester carboxylesterase